MSAAFISNILFSSLLFSSPGVASVKKPPKWKSKNFLDAGWVMAMPVGSSYQKTGKLSFLGATAGYNFRINNSFSAGISGSWHLFEDMHLVTEKISDSITVTTHKREEFRTFDVFATGSFYFINGENRSILPCLRWGIGALNSYRNSRTTDYESTVESWHFGLQAELLMTILVKNVPLNLGLGAARGFKTQDNPSESFISFIFGISLPN
ncbi:MAG: hypothetical protein JXR91_06510 [Deltaproteobacteria bacterium]|nr:hypothetical protein [Deltaproteobacteria bacterium]